MFGTFLGHFCILSNCNDKLLWFEVVPTTKFFFQTHIFLEDITKYFLYAICLFQDFFFFGFVREVACTKCQ